MHTMEEAGEAIQSEESADVHRRIVYDANLHNYLRAKYDILSSLEEPEETLLLLPPRVEMIEYPTCSVLEPPKFSRADIYSYFFDKYTRDRSFKTFPRMKRMESVEYSNATDRKEYTLDAYGLLEVLMFAITLVSALSLTSIFQFQVFLKTVLLQESPSITEQKINSDAPMSPLPQTPPVSSPVRVSEPPISIDIPSPKAVVKGSPAALINDENRPNSGLHYRLLCI